MFPGRYSEIFGLGERLGCILNLGQSFDAISVSLNLLVCRYTLARLLFWQVSVAGPVARLGIVVVVREGGVKDVALSACSPSSVVRRLRNRWRRGLAS